MLKWAIVDKSVIVRWLVSVVDSLSITPEAIVHFAELLLTVDIWQKL